MDAPAWSTYREPGRPEPRVFTLQPSGGIAGRAYITTVVSLILTVALYVISDGRGLVIMCAPLVGVAVARLFGYGPRAIEVDVDGVVVRSRLRPPRRIAASDLRVYLLPGELVLVGPATCVQIGADRFPERSFAACTDALREIGPHP